MSRGEPSGQSETVNLTKRQPFELGVFHKQTVAATAVKPLRDFQKSASDCKSVTTGNVRTSMQLGRRKSNRFGKTAAAESAYGSIGLCGGSYCLRVSSVCDRQPTLDCQSSVTGTGHIYCCASAIANKFALLSASAYIWPDGHIYGCASAITSKLALHSASALYLA